MQGKSRPTQTANIPHAAARNALIACPPLAFSHLSVWRPGMDARNRPAALPENCKSTAAPGEFALERLHALLGLGPIPCPSVAVRGARPVQRRNAREKLLTSEKPSR